MERVDALLSIRSAVVCSCFVDLCYFINHTLRRRTRSFIRLKQLRRTL